MRTYEDVRNAVLRAKQTEGFVEFCPPLEEQIARSSIKLLFRVDVSNGCKQLFQSCWVAIENRID